MREEECEVGGFCPLYSSLREVSTRGVVGTSGSAIHAGECVLFLSSVAIGLAFCNLSLLGDECERTGCGFRHLLLGGECCSADRLLTLRCALPS